MDGLDIQVNFAPLASVPTTVLSCLNNNHIPLNRGDWLPSFFMVCEDIFTVLHSPIEKRSSIEMKCKIQGLLQDELEEH
ncbi:hypothetical protein [Pseudomonas fluorescens]|uniref:hypothetical protein n=1 Tax=Pseudomonas fluorescens TaxID=294 RepID=UPI0012421CAB|nr:hypothetical protein [Pseudomonas fluorescens]